MVGKMKTAAFIMVMLATTTTGWMSNLNAQTINDAILLTHRQQFMAAEKAFETLVSQQPQNGNNYFHFGQNYIQHFLADTASVSLKKSLADAMMVFDKGNAADPTNPINLVGLAEIALFQKDTSKANIYFAKANNLLPGKRNKIKMEKPITANIYTKMADAYVISSTKDTASIFKYLRLATKLDPKYFEIYLVKGDAYFYILNDGTNAIYNYNIASRYNPQSASAQLRIGQLWVRSRNYNDALTTYLEVVKMDPTFAPAYKELGFLYAKNGDNNNAKINFQRFLELSSGNTEAHLQYINTLFSLKDYKEAANQAEQILKTDSSNVDVYRALAYSNFEIGKPEQAKQGLEQFFKKTAVENIRSYDYAYYARSLAKMHMDSLAGVNFLKAYDLDTTKTGYLSEAITVFNSAKAYNQSIKLYQKKIQLNLETMSAYFYLGYYLYVENRYNESDSTFAILSSKAPDYIPAYLWRARALSMTDPDSKTGVALPVYQMLIEKTDSSATKYATERAEAFSFITFYYFQQFSQTKAKDTALKAMEYGEKVLAINPNDEKAKQIIDNIKRNLNKPAKPVN